MTVDIVKAAEPAIDITVEQEKDGVVEPRVLVRFTASEQVIEEIAERNFRNAHFLVAVVTPWQEHFGDMNVVRYDQRSVYLVPMTRPYQYIQFERPGQNTIVVTIVDIRDREDGHNASAVRHRNKSVGYYDPESDFPRYPAGFDRFLNVKSVKDVSVPAELFAPEPAGWKKTLVQHFFRGRISDQCGFRKRWMLGAVAWLFVQLAGLIIRPALLCAALLHARREIRYQDFFGFWPTMLWRTAGDSWWLYDDQGDERSSKEGKEQFLPLVSPAALAVYATVLLGVPAIVFGFFNIRMHHGMSETKSAWIDWGWWSTVIVVDGVILAVVALLAILVFVLVPAIDALPSSNKLSGAEARRRAEIEAYYAQLRSANRPDGDLSWEAVPAQAKTVVLRFHNLKTKVCRPFAK